MDALKYLNSFGLPDVGKHRNAELNALLSPEFRTALQRQGAILTTYGDLIKQVGLEKMVRPE